MVMSATTISSGNDGGVIRQPVYYHPEIWGKYQADTANTANIKKTSGQKVISRKALLHHPDEWQTL